MVMYRGMKKATLEERAHMARVKQLPCCVGHMLQMQPTEVHHIVRGKRLGHFYVIPLCGDCHGAVHLLHDIEQKLWEETNAKLGVIREWPESKIVARRTA